MFDKSAIDALALSQAQAIQAADTAAAAAMKSDGVVALPRDWLVHDIESWLPNRRRARGAMSTRLIDDFAKYVDLHAEDGASVFVNPERMTALAVLNLGTPEKPGHADSTATFAPQKTAAYTALVGAENRSGIVAGQCNQQRLAEFLEDWTDVVACWNSAGDIATKHAIAAVRKVTIEAISRSENTQEQLSASRSAFEAVKASSGDAPLPTFIAFDCKPYVGLEPRRFVMRVTVHTDGKAPTFSLRIVTLETHEEQMANELATLVRDHVTEVPVFIGTYANKA